MQVMCERCPQWASCLLNYRGKACKKNRKEHCPDVIYTNEDMLREMPHDELLQFLIDLANGGNLRIEEWLGQSAE